MVYVTLGRGQLIGSSVRITKSHFPHVFDVVERCASIVGVPMPLVFVRDDQIVPVVALGFGEPYALIISSHWLHEFKEDELTFAVGRELGHIAAGHTRFTSLLSVNGKENAIVSIIFGAWLRRTEYTADRVGLLCCGSFDAASRAIAVLTFHSFARRVDLETFAMQRAELTDDSMLRLGEWFSAVPYATNRFDALRSFKNSVLFAHWEEQLLQAPQSHAAIVPMPRTDHVTKADCPHLGRRLAAVLVDFILVAALFQGIPDGVSEGAASQKPGVSVKVNDKALNEMKDEGVPGWVTSMLAFTQSGRNIRFIPVSWKFLVYNFVLVAIVGQTFGMMIFAIKVTTEDFRRPPLVLALWRYIIATPLAVCSYIFTPLARIQLHDRFSGTRVVRIERALQRAALTDA